MWALSLCQALVLPARSDLTSITNPVRQALCHFAVENMGHGEVKRLFQAHTAGKTQPSNPQSQAPETPCHLDACARDGDSSPPAIRLSQVRVHDPASSQIETLKTSVLQEQAAPMQKVQCGDPVQLAE